MGYKRLSGNKGEEERPKVEIGQDCQGCQQQQADDEPDIHEAASRQSEIVGYEGDGVREEKGKREGEGIGVPQEEEEKGDLEGEERVEILARADFVVIGSAPDFDTRFCPKLLVADF